MLTYYPTASNVSETKHIWHKLFANHIHLIGQEIISNAQVFSQNVTHVACCLNDQRVILDELVEGVRPASQNFYPIYDQNMRYFLPYLLPDQKYENLFMTWPLIAHRNSLSDLRYN